MAVTIQMIENKEFKIIPRGYDPEEVDLFLDSIVDEFEAMQNEIKSLRAAAAAEERRGQAHVQTQAAPKQAATDETIRTMLVNAQRICDETVAEAKLQAQALINQAKRDADNIALDARAEARRLEEGMTTLRNAVADYRARFKRLIEDQAHLLDADKTL